jgi:hypothetical protein
MEKILIRALQFIAVAPPGLLAQLKATAKRCHLITMQMLMQLGAQLLITPNLALQLLNMLTRAELQQDLTLPRHTLQHTPVIQCPRSVE